MATRRPDPFIEHLLELMGPLAARIGPVTAKRMFGGHGLFYDGLMFALVSAGTCYLKADDTTRGKFDAEGSEPFRYQSARREVTMRHYLSLPPAALESPAAMTPWAKLAVEAALRLGNAG
ncbi:TfoX/Sxy family protein [Cupriavidus alkaliphilus]|uniref:TfoX/Sxy family protein n=1 Tax=Cupriavidus alkaliphilus TaxID=942866 RepID=UPI001619640E|nr:TfoX/Sxy family protein [Cupriavidus alkaliphilus]MBB3016788.1 DNA transformation protein [Cupriavidus alkaliphilus]